MPIFVLEYIFRLYASGYLSEYKGLKGKLKYALTSYAIIDLLSILPYFLTSVGFNSSFIRSLRLLRVFRLLRVKKYTVFIQLMKKIINNIKEEITVLLFFTFIVLIILSFVMYDIEHRAQPEVFTDIFQTMWWSVATLTTVGYGDMFPITAAGKLITSLITVMGIGFIAIPGGMFASEFISEIIKNRDTDNNKIDKCLKCDSVLIKSYNDPKLSFSNKNCNYKKVKICENCNFIVFNEGYVIDLSKEEFRFPATDVENSLVSILTFEKYRDYARVKKIALKDISDIYIDRQRVKVFSSTTNKTSKTIYTINIVGFHGSNNLNFSSRSLSGSPSPNTNFAIIDINKKQFNRYKNFYGKSLYQLQQETSLSPATQYR